MEEDSMANYVTTTSDKKKGTALLLCIFLGYFGAHQFYVGNIGKGVLYLFTVGIFGIGWFIDVFKIFSQPAYLGRKLTRCEFFILN